MMDEPWKKLDSWELLFLGKFLDLGDEPRPWGAIIMFFHVCYHTIDVFCNKVTVLLSVLRTADNLGVQQGSV